MFTQSPIEGAIWTSFAAIQQWLVDNILLTTLFKLSVISFFGFLFIKVIYQIGTNKSPGTVIGKFTMALLISAIGFSLLKTKATDSFRPETATGKAWNSYSKIRDSQKYSGLFSSTNGLYFYVQIHRGVNQISKFISGKIGELFKNQNSNQSPYLLILTLTQTASQTIDDPHAVASLNWLFENCSNPRSAPILNPNSSFSNLFDLTNEDCKTRYSQLRKELVTWSQNKWGSSLWNKGDIAFSYLKSKFGYLSEETLQNKMIASALVNAAREQMGRNNRQNVNNKALLVNPTEDPMTASTTTYFTGLSNSISVGGFLNALISPITGGDLYGADMRNKSATIYNQILQFLPSIRGYAKGLLALFFVFAAASMCFGTPRFIVSWFGMLLIFTLYEPLSTILYESVMLFSNAKETTDALQALQSDPLILSGAAIIDDNLARLQSIYFSLQIGLAFVCAAGGISIFMFTKRMGGGLADSILSKAVGYISIARIGGVAASGQGAATLAQTTASKNQEGK